MLRFFIWERNMVDWIIRTREYKLQKHTYLPTAKTLPKVNNKANLIGFAKTIIDCKGSVTIALSAVFDVIFPKLNYKNHECRSIFDIGRRKKITCFSQLINNTVLKSSRRQTFIDIQKLFSDTMISFSNRNFLLNLGTLLGNLVLDI